MCPRPVSIHDRGSGCRVRVLGALIGAMIGHFVLDLDLGVAITAIGSLVGALWFLSPGMSVFAPRQVT